jgi:hypothetical protein
VTADISLPVRRLQEALDRLAGQTLGRPLTGRTHADADDISGTVLTDDAVGFDPLPLLRALDRAGARVVVIGQVAGIMHGSRELTGDLDLLWDGDAAQAGPLAAAFAGPSARLTDDDGDLVRDADGQRPGRQGYRLRPGTGRPPPAARLNPPGTFTCNALRLSWVGWTHRKSPVSVPGPWARWSSQFQVSRTGR